MNIIIYGLRGTGKTTIGKLLAKKLKRKFIDTDEARLKKFKQTTEEVVKYGGWPAFRIQEKETTLDIAKKYDNVIIAVGGGAMMDPENSNALKKNGKAVLLIADIETMAGRISQDKAEKRSNRPFLMADKNLEGEVWEVWKQRKATYLKLADLVVDTSEMGGEEAVNNIIKKLNIKNQKLKRQIKD